MALLNGEMLYTVYNFNDENVRHTDGNIYHTLDRSVVYTHKHELYIIHDINNPPKNLINVNYFLRYHNDSSTFIYVVPFTIDDYNNKSEYIKYLININNFRLPNFNIKSYYIDYNKSENDKQYSKNITKYQNQVAAKKRFIPTINDFLKHVQYKETIEDTDTFLSTVDDMDLRS